MRLSSLLSALPLFTFATVAVAQDPGGNPLWHDTFANFTAVTTNGATSPTSVAGSSWLLGNPVAGGYLVGSTGASDGNSYIRILRGETAPLRLSPALSGFASGGRRHQVAARVRLAGPGTNGERVPFLNVVLGNGVGPAYTLGVNVLDTGGQIAVETYRDSAGAKSSVGIGGGITQDSWIYVVVQFEGPSSNGAADGGFLAWTNPIDPTSNPNVNQGSGVGAGSTIDLGGTTRGYPANGDLRPTTYLFGPGLFSSSATGPSRVEVDRVAFWDLPGDLTSGGDVAFFRRGLAFLAADTTAPTPTFSSVTTPRTTRPTSLALNFGEQVYGVLATDLTITRDASPISPTIGVSLGSLFTISGAALAPDGTYVATYTPNGNTVDGNGVTITSTATVSWVIDATGPTGTWSAVSPATREGHLPSATITFNEPPVFAGPYSTGLTLTRTGPNAGNVPLSVANNSVVISGNQMTIPFTVGQTGLVGDYTLNTGLASAVTDALGNSHTIPTTPLTFSIVAGDGVADATENAGPNGGDGNNDSIPDRLQPNVASLPNAVGGQYVTLVTNSGRFTNVAASTAASLTSGITPSDFPIGFLGFQITGISNGGSATVELISATPFDSGITRFYKWGLPTAGAPAPLLRNFLWTGSGTGAEKFSSTTYRLRLTDGAFGDTDWTANGTIVDPGAPGVQTPLFVQLARLEATTPALGQPVTVLWTTEAEIDSVGFNLFRVNEDGTKGTQVNAAVIASTGDGSTYTVVDEPATEGESRRYRLEEIDASGKLTLFGPVPLEITARNSAVSEWTLF